MRLGIIFGTDDANLATAVDLRKVGIIPDDIRSKIAASGLNLNYVSSIAFDRTTTNVEIFAKIEQARKFCDGLIFICCENCRSKLEEFRDCLFVYVCDLYRANDNVVNYLRANLSKALKRFILFHRNFSRLGERKFLLLPFLSFKSNDLDRLRVLMHEVAAAPDFFTEFEKLLGLLRDRQWPKRKSSYPTRFILDDAGKFFDYGHEKHGGPETLVPPHKLSCDANGSLRFGIAFDRDRHFNVSLDGDKSMISGEYLNCHSEKVAVGPSTHLNIFPNGSI